MRTNYSNDMTGWFIIAGILVVIGFVICYLRNRSMDEANDRYRDAVGAANRAVYAANDKLKMLEEALKEQNHPLENLDGILQMRKEYSDLLKDAESKRNFARSCGNDAYDAYSRGVTIQNVFLGGANDLSVFSLRRRYNEYRSIGSFSSLKDPTEVLVRIERYVTIAMLAGSGKIAEPAGNLPDRGNTEQKAEPERPAKAAASEAELDLLPLPKDSGTASQARQEPPQNPEKVSGLKSPVRRAVVALVLVVTLIIGGVYAYQRFALGNETPFRLYPAARASALQVAFEPEPAERTETADSMAPAVPVPTVYTMVQEKIAARSGPSAKYAGLGIYTVKGKEARVLSRVFDGSGWWLQIEFECQGTTIRCYTGMKQTDMDLSTVPDESGQHPENGTVVQTTKAYFGPGEGYKTMKAQMSPAAGTKGKVISKENGWVCFEYDYYNKSINSTEIARVWLPEDCVV